LRTIISQHQHTPTSGFELLCAIIGVLATRCWVGWLGEEVMCINKITRFDLVDKVEIGKYIWDE
jgi:hypothetical protein